MPVILLVAAGAWVIAVAYGDGTSEVQTGSNGVVSDAAHQRTWVIPTFLDEPLEAIHIMTQTSDTSGSVSLRMPGEPDAGILIFSDPHGITGSSGDPVEINDKPGYVSTARRGADQVVDVEWQLAGRWQVFQTIGRSELDALEAARLFETDGISGLTSNGWEVVPQEAPNEVITIVGGSANGVLMFYDDPTLPPGAEVVAESNGFTVYQTRVSNLQYWVSYKGRIVFAYATGEPYDYKLVPTPEELANGLQIVSEKQWRDWLGTWTVLNR